MAGFFLGMLRALSWRKEWNGMVWLEYFYWFGLFLYTDDIEFGLKISDYLSKIYPSQNLTENSQPKVTGKM